ncbi:LysR family transcriptional regulator [Candidatus Phyllobacterium onerii]|uniref:LysR family transcriptional regulator n=1 Tax=Candidatus Phyllobacterium onerii TaxID=3020828 RepID=UPI00232DD278|nr:LysR family transcriptional regulator [Phyllobacterium sp. IY22]
MHPRLLKTFQAVARNRNITHAARDINLSQSAASDQVQALEADLAAQLFVRSTRGLELTPAGHTLLAYADEILSLSDDARAAVASVAGSKQGSLAIGALSTIVSSKFPEWLIDFRGKYPEIAIRLKVAGSGDLMQQLETGMLDAVFCFDRGDFDHRLANRLIATEPLILITPRTGKFALKSGTLAELASASFVATEVGCVYRSLFDNAFADAGIMQPKLAMEAGSIQAIAELVKSGAGISLVPQLAVADALQRGEVNGIPWPGPLKAVSLVMVWRRRRVQPPTLKLLLAAANEGLSRV